MTNLRLAMVLLPLLAGSALAAEWEPRDHAGGDLVLADGDLIWGLHENVGSFVLPEGASARVLAYDGSDEATGSLEVRAESVQILGVLDGAGAGYSGGSGGGGGAGSRMTFLGGMFVVVSGSSGVAGEVPYAAPGIQGSGLQGGIGDGPHGGSGDGGYLAPGANGDTTTDDHVVRGSGGGGGQGGGGTTGWNEGGNGGSGGGAGGRGGAVIRLSATAAFQMGQEGAVIVDGARGGDAPERTYIHLDGDRGGHATESGAGRGGLFGGTTDGGSGAGGGVLIDLREASSIQIAPGARVTSRGGGGSLHNGGTVKILTEGAAPGLDTLTIRAGRVVANGQELSTLELWAIY